MKKYGKLFAANAAFAIGEVLLFSPGFLGLSPFSPNALAAAGAVAVIAMSVPSFILMNKALLTENRAKLLEMDEENAGRKAVGLLKSYGSSKVLGGIARSAIGQAERMEQHLSTFEKLVIRRFGAGTLSYKKFMGIVRCAGDAMEKGAVKIANKMAVFDEKEYGRLRSGAYKLDDIPDPIQEEKRKLYEENLEDMRQILEKNEKMLFEVEQLMLKMPELDCTEQDMEGAAEQIRELLGQLEYYGQGTKGNRLA